MRATALPRRITFDADPAPTVTQRKPLTTQQRFRAKWYEKNAEAQRKKARERWRLMNWGHV